MLQKWLPPRADTVGFTYDFFNRTLKETRKSHYRQQARQCLVVWSAKNGILVALFGNLVAL